MTELHPALIAFDRADRMTRSQALLDLYHLPSVMPRHEWFTNLGQMWAGFRIDKHYDQYCRIFNAATRAEKDLMMTREERGSFNTFPSLIPVSRGCNQFTQRGLSWTLNPKVASTFASMALHFSDKGLVPLVLTGYVRKERAVYKNNGLSEIIAIDVTVVDTKVYTGGAFCVGNRPS